MGSRGSPGPTESLTRELFRAVNKQVQSLTLNAGDEELDYVCECADTNCFAPLRVTRVSYEQALFDGCFVVADGHASDGDEVIRRTDGFVVVRPLLPGD